MGRAHSVGYFGTPLVKKLGIKTGSELLRLRCQVVQNGVIWVSWPKKTAKVPTDVTEDVLRKLALACGLVDVKVAVVDAVGSGLKLVGQRKGMTGGVNDSTAHPTQPITCSCNF